MHLLFLFLATRLALCWSISNDFEEYDGYNVLKVTRPAAHAEGPHWFEKEQALYYVDISGFGVHRFDPYTTEHTSITLCSPVALIIPIQGEKDKFVIGFGTNVTILTWDGRSKEYSLEHKFRVDIGKTGNRFNDGKADARGRLWMGSMGEEKPVGVVKPNQGSLYRVTKNCDLSKIISPVSISNGIIWNADSTKMYYIDSPTRKIDVFDYDLCKGEISNRKTLFSFDTYNITGVPDGMTIDNDDNLWIAAWGGWKVLQVSSEGELMTSIRIPAERVTSVAWGGLDYGTLFVTTMRKGLNASELRKQPNAGAVFKIVGLPERGRPASSASSCILHTPSLH